MDKFQPYTWQSDELQRLRQTIEQGRLPHAVLLSGAIGVGKRHFANCLIYLVIQKHSKSERAENLLMADSHPDVLRISPLDDKKHISIDQIRELSARVSLTPQLSGVKVALIAPAESMTESASDALLKTLEEPPGNSLIILVSHNNGQLPQTVYSRCHHLSLKIPDIQLAQEWLAGQGIEDSRKCLQLARGAPLLARQLAKEGSWAEKHDQLVADLVLLANNRADIMSAANHWRDVDLLLLIDWLKHLVNALIKAKFSGNDISAVAKELKTIAEIADWSSLINYFDYLDKSILEIGNNPNQELFLEQIFAQWAILFSND